MKAAREQVAERLRTKENPPWVWYRLMKLQEALDQVLCDLEDPMIRTENSLQSESPPEMRLRLVDATCPQDSAPLRRGEKPEPLPKSP